MQNKLQELTDRLYNEGLSKGKQEGEELLAKAKVQADEMIAKGEKVDIQDVLKNLQERDYIDSHRSTSPLTQAEDAIVLDNSHMTMEDQMSWLKNLIKERFGC